MAECNCAGSALQQRVSPMEIDLEAVENATNDATIIEDRNDEDRGCVSNQPERARCGFNGCTKTWHRSASAAQVAAHFRQQHESLMPQIEGCGVTCLNSPAPFAHCGCGLLFANTARSIGKHESPITKGKPRIFGLHPNCQCAGCQQIWDNGDNLPCPCTAACAGATPGLSPILESTDEAIQTRLDCLAFLDSVPDEVAYGVYQHAKRCRKSCVIAGMLHGIGFSS